MADERQQFGAATLPPPVPKVVPERRRPRPAQMPPARRSASIRFLGLQRLLSRALESELEHGNAFLFVPVCLAIGALAYYSTGQDPGFTPLLLAGGALAGLVAACRERPMPRAGFLALLMVLTGMLAAKIETSRVETQMLGSEVTTFATARVVRIEHQASGRIRLTLDVLGTDRPRLRYAPQRVRVTARSVPDGLRPGDSVQGVVRLLPASGPVRPRSYDFSFRSYFDGIGAVGFFLSGPQPAAGPPPTLAEKAGAWVEGLRQRMAVRIETIIGGPEGAIAAALITGVRAGIPEEINEALRVTGLYHVISISGLHMALVAGTLMVALRSGFALAPSFSMRRPIKKYAAGAALAATTFYLLLSGADVAAQRSFIMLAVMLLAVMADRAALTMRNLAISAIIILLAAPHEVMGPSFQMSFAATAALVAAYAAWTNHRERRSGGSPPRLPLPIAVMRTGVRYAVGLSMTSVIAGLATALFTAWHFQQVSPLGLVANLAAMPFVSVIVMPMAVLASLLMPFGLDAPPLHLMGQGIAAMNAIAIWLAERSAFDATGAIPLSAVLALAAALAILTMAGSVLRWAAAPLAVIGIAMLVLSRAVPDVLIAEDGRLVAMRLSDGRVAVNRARPRAFTIQNWLRAFGASEIARPGKAEDGGELLARLGSAGDETGFLCGDKLCIARHASGVVVVHARDVASALPACGHAAVIVIDDATARNPCVRATTAVVTKRDLARRGSAEIMLRHAASPGAMSLRFAIDEPYRPWHEHRRFSREARGLPARQPSARNRSDDVETDG